MQTPTVEQLLALAAEWEAKAAEEVDSGNGSEYSRESLAAGVFEECAADLRHIVARASQEGAR